MMCEAYSEQVGVVAIGRNEGERLERCLRSVIGRASAVVYVDSGSTDGSIDLAESMGVEVLKLDTSMPFSAARARNAGVERLAQVAPGIGLVQFVDADCEVREGWLERAAAELCRRQDIAVVCGRRRERFPKMSVYNHLCDLEWDTPIGEAEACGGDAMTRLDAFLQVGGFNASIIAGEEPELCARLRRANWKILRIDSEMTLHDAAMTRFIQWWKRGVRAGYGFAEGASSHSRSSEQYYVREARSVCFWALLLPCVSLLLALPTDNLSLLLLLAYPLQWSRIVLRERTAGRSPIECCLRATFMLLGKLAQLMGIARFQFNRLTGKHAQLIEYK